MTDHSATKANLEKHLQLLLARVEEIDANLSAEPEDDWEERATELENSNVLDKLGISTLNEITQIKAAISQIESGKYGTCKRCGKQIAPARLKAMPSAVTCVACI